MFIPFLYELRALKVPVGTVKTHTSRALTALRAALAPPDEET